MKNKRGFTLIELLAVIVILAIIALIATPIILNMINDARKNSAKSSALGYIDAIEYNNGFAQLGTTDISGTYEEIKSGDVTTANQKLGNHLKGKAPTSGTVTIDTKGKVTAADFCINGYNVTYDGKEAKVNGKCNGSNNNNNNNEPQQPSVLYTAYSVGDSINYNPTTNDTCDNPVSTTGTKAGCMKWYVISASGVNDTTVDVILDHNTTTKVAYETSETYKEYAQASIKSQVDTDTTGWTSGLNPRLITAQEVADITNITTFNGSSSTWFYFNGTGANKQTNVSSSQGANPYKWLFDYTNSCTSFGCNTADSSTSGYWTSSPVSDISHGAWYVDRSGSLYYNSVDYGSSYYVDDGSRYGVRPVITISKSQISS